MLHHRAGLAVSGPGAHNGASVNNEHALASTIVSQSRAGWIRETRRSWFSACGWSGRGNWGRRCSAWRSSVSCGWTLCLSVARWTRFYALRATRPLIRVHPTVAEGIRMNSKGLPVNVPGFAYATSGKGGPPEVRYRPSAPFVGRERCSDSKGKGRSIPVRTPPGRSFWQSPRGSASGRCARPAPRCTPGRNHSTGGE